MKLFIASVELFLCPDLLMIVHSVPSMTEATFHAGHGGDKNSPYTAFQLNWSFNAVSSLIGPNV